MRSGFKPLLGRLGMRPGTATLVARTGPVLAIAAAILAVATLGLEERGVAVVGQVPGTEHYRNVERHAVVTSSHVLSLRIDESPTFANARAFETVVQRDVAAQPAVRHVVLQCSAINAIDASALESLELTLHRLCDVGIALHLSEVKGPVMDRLGRTDLLDHLTGQVFLTQHQAMRRLDPDMTRRADMITCAAVAAR